jgi:hypothetical protein
MTVVRRVCVESPYGSDDPAIVARNVRYADLCMADSLKRGEAPFLGHLLYTRVLNDRDPVERERGITAHLAWAGAADVMAVYVDLGVSPGMKLAIAFAMSIGIETEHRAIGLDWAQEPGGNSTPG